MLNFRQTYTIEVQIYRVGDLTIKLGTIYKETLSKSIFLEINNPYSNKFEDTKDFSIETLQSIFNIQNIQNYCVFDNTLEKLLKENKLKMNNHSEYLQYAHFILQKKY
jgi:hypothetical protein